MIVLDTSALVAVLAEGDGELFEAAMARAGSTLLSAVDYHEAGVVLGSGRFGPPAAVLADLETVLTSANASVVPFDRDQALLAREAYRMFGKGTGHAARLNLTDCASYALARRTGLPLLYKGNDFARTDVLKADVGPVP